MCLSVSTKGHGLKTNIQVTAATTKEIAKMIFTCS